MLNWEKIDNEKIFQRFVNHLFALECNSPGFIPSSPYIGADGAWDGRYEGHYSLEGTEGIWSIQSKWTTKSFKEAIPHLKKEIKKELKNAKKKGVQHLRIATSAELKAEQVVELESLNSGDVETFKIWHREELTRRIELQPFLRHHFFGLPQYPKFVPSELYFQQTEKHLIPVPAAKIAKFKDYLDRIGQFVGSAATNILLIHSPGGYGKSHLLRDIQEKAYNIDPERQTWMTRQGYRKIEDAIQEEIIDGRKYLLVFDDADRFSEDIKPILSSAKHRGGSIKVILALRTSGLQLIHEVINELRSEETYDEMSIKTWTREELIQLLRMVTGQEKVEDGDTWAALYPNPYLIVWIGRQMKKEPTIDFKKVKEKFVNDVDYEAKRCLKDIFNESTIKEFVANLACIAPFSDRDPNALKVLSEKFSTKVELVTEKIDMLNQAGVLRQLGSSLRFDPDMKGDLYLAYSVEKSDLNRLRNLVLTWLPGYAEKLFINLESAARYGEVPELKKIFSEILDFWTKEARRTPAIVREERLRLVEKIANIAPNSAINLLHSYLHSEAPLSEDAILKSLGTGDIKFRTDDYGPVIIKLLRIPDVRRDTIEITEEINQKGIEGFYDNYKPLSLIKIAVSPLYNSPAVILATLDIFLRWLHHPSASKIKLITAGMSEVLAGTHSFTKSTIGGIVFGEKVVRPTKEIVEVRDKALDVLKRMLRSELLEVKLAGIKAAEEIGTSRGGVGPRGTLPLSGRIAKEREEIIDEIGKLISKDADFLLLGEIEDLFVRWWAMEMPGTNKVEDYLGKFPRETEYIVYRYFTSPEYIVKDFTSMEKEAPKKGRWVWFVHNVMHNKNYHHMNYFEPEAKILNEKYGTEEKATTYLAGLYEKISPHEKWPRPQIINCWVNLNPKLFVAIRKDSGLWEKILERFQNEIDLAIGAMDKEFVNKLAKEVLSELPKTSPFKMHTFLTMLRWEVIEEETLDSWLSEIVEKGTPEHRVLVISHLDSIFEKNKNINLVLKLSQAGIIRDKDLSYRMVDNLSFLFRHLEEDLEKADRGLLDKVREDLLPKLKDLPSLEDNSQVLLEFAFRGIDSVVDFIEYRLKKSKEIRDKGEKDRKFDAIPYGGLGCIKSQITCFSDYEKLMDKVMEWHKEDSPYRQFYLDYLMEPIEGLIDKDSERLFIEEYIERQIEKKNIKNAILAAECLSLNEDTIGLLVKVGEVGIAEGFPKDIEGLLDRKAYSGGWSGKPGEVPPELEERKAILQKMNEMTKPGELRMIVEKCIEMINDEVKDKLERDEEFLSPRG
jgi:hypothetical protein